MWLRIAAAAAFGSRSRKAAMILACSAIASRVTYA
jgi:hypothetical protein